MRDTKSAQRMNASPGMVAWANECAGWLALGEAEEARGIYEIGRYDEFVWARPLPGVGPKLPVMLLVEGTATAGVSAAAGDAPENVDRTADAGGEGNRERVEYVAEGLYTAVQTFGVRGTPLYLALPPEGDIDTWRDAARSVGCKHESVQLLMSCPLPRGMEVRKPARFDVSEATSDDAWEAALDVIGDVYGDPRGMTAFYNPRDKVRLFLARSNEEPVAAAALWPFAGAAGIYSVATKPRFRGLGLAYAVVEFMLETALQEGFPLATLRTTGDLLSVYLRHGFGLAGQVQRYRLDM